MTILPLVESTNPNDIYSLISYYNMTKMLPMKITFTYVKHSGKTHKLKYPIILDVEIDDDEKYILFNNQFKLLAVAPTLGEGITAINNEFNQIWETYVMCKKIELTDGGLKFREKLKRMFL